MKVLFVTLTALFSLFTTKSHADDGNVSATVLRSFNSTFVNASEVKWSTNDKFYKADFSFNCQYVSAYFDADGELIATTKNITSLELPIKLQASLKKDYQNGWISDLFEYSDASGTSYFITIENADTKIVLKSDGISAWNTFQKQCKS